jgi:hypothetical protein
MPTRASRLLTAWLMADAVTPRSPLALADTAFRWLDDARNFTKRDQLRATSDALLA